MEGFTEADSGGTPDSSGNNSVVVKLANGTQIVFNNNISVEHLKAFL